MRLYRSVSEQALPLSTTALCIQNAWALVSNVHSKLIDVWGHLGNGLVDSINACQWKGGGTLYSKVSIPEKPATCNSLRQRSTLGVGLIHTVLPNTKPLAREQAHESNRDKGYQSMARTELTALQDLVRIGYFSMTGEEQAFHIERWRPPLGHTWPG
jgi:hypothetical protein